MERGRDKDREMEDKREREKKREEEEEEGEEGCREQAKACISASRAQLWSRRASQFPQIRRV